MAAELERSRDLSRVIVHVDMDAFYAAVEMRDCPELKDKPMAVGSMSMLVSSNITKNYNTRTVTLCYWSHSTTFCDKIHYKSFNRCFTNHKNEQYL